jgi:hypothetical protein
MRPGQPIIAIRLLFGVLNGCGPANEAETKLTSESTERAVYDSLGGIRGTRSSFKCN